MAKKISIFLIGILIIALWTAVFIYCSKAVRNNSNMEVEVITPETSTEAETAADTTTEETTQALTYYNENVPDSVWAELQEKTGLSEKELSNELKKYEALKDSQAYSWDNSEAPLTDEQIKEIEAEQASILAELNAAETTEELTETTTAEIIIEEVTEVVTEEVTENIDEDITSATDTETETVSADFNTKGVDY